MYSVTSCKRAMSPFCQKCHRIEQPPCNLTESTLYGYDCCAQSPQTVRRLQAAVHRMGYSNYVNAVELDMAFGPGTGTGECTTLDEQLTVLLAPGRPALLARTSKGALAEGWRKDAAEAAAAKQRALEVLQRGAAASEALEGAGAASEALQEGVAAESETLEGSASEALKGVEVAAEAPYSPFIIGPSTRKVLAAAAAEVMSTAVTSPSSPGAGASGGAAPGPASPATAAAGLEEDMWFDAGSNVSR